MGAREQSYQRRLACLDQDSLHKAFTAVSSQPDKTAERRDAPVMLPG